MKKKILIAMILSFVLATGVVSAATNWGKFEGNNIVRLLINGKEANVKDVPAVMLNNRTMVPIYLLKDAGLNVSWDGKTSTVSINAKTASNVSSKTQSDIDNLKELYQVSDFYKQSYDLGNELVTFNNSLSLAFTSINQYDDRKFLDDTYTHLDNSINYFNELSNFLNNNKLLFTNAGIDYNKTMTIYNDYYDAIENYKDSLNYLEYYYSYKANSDFNNYISASQKGFNTSINSRTDSQGYYFVLNDKILDY